MFLLRPVRVMRRAGNVGYVCREASGERRRRGRRRYRGRGGGGAGVGEEEEEEEEEEEQGGGENGKDEVEELSFAACMHAAFHTHTL